MHHINTEILKEYKNLRTELKELTAITKTWLSSSNKVNQCISEQIPSQRKRILGVDQLTKDSSSSGQKDLVFIKSSADDTKMSITNVERPWLSEAEGFILLNYNIRRILPAKSQRNTTNLSVAVTDSSATDYDSMDKSSVCSTPLPLLKKLDGAEPIFGPMNIKLVLRYQTNNNDVSFIEPNESPEPVFLEIEALSDQNSQTDQNDQSAQTDEILNNNLSEHSNHNNDETIIDNLPNTKYIQISVHLFSLNVEDTSIQDTISILNPPLPIPSMVTPAPQDRWYQDKHIELVNIIGNLGAVMLTRAIVKQVSVASTHECLFVNFLSKEEPKKVFEALKRLGWVDAMQDELNQFARNKGCTLVLVPYGKTIIGLKWVFRIQKGSN
nr:retrovirus-related Pol polyprotein from transposon TNT 1-94 [Tanacetum cinerariifolium]